MASKGLSTTRKHFDLLRNICLLGFCPLVTCKSWATWPTKFEVGVWASGSSPGGSTDRVSRIRRIPLLPWQQSGVGGKGHEGPASFWTLRPTYIRDQNNGRIQEVGCPHLPAGKMHETLCSPEHAKAILVGLARTSQVGHLLFYLGRICAEPWKVAVLPQPH